MSRKILGVFLLMGGLGTASVFGGQIAVLAEKIPAMFVTNDDAHAVPVRDLDDPGRRAFARRATPRASPSPRGSGWSSNRSACRPRWRRGKP